MVLNKFLTTLPVKDIIEELNRRHIETYISRLLVRNTNRTGNAHLTALKSFFRWLSVNYDVPNHAEKIPMLKEEIPNQRVLSQDEFKRVLAICRTKKEQHTVLFLAFTGLRASEVCKVKWGDISPDLKWLKVHGKGRKARSVPLNSVLRQEVFSQYPRTKPETHIQFLESKRHRLYRLCRSLSNRARLFRVAGPHSYRHYCFTEMYRRGVNINFISILAGHHSTKFTESVYIHLQPHHLDGITEILCQ